MNCINSGQTGYRGDETETRPQSSSASKHTFRVTSPFRGMSPIVPFITSPVVSFIMSRVVSWIASDTRSAYSCHAREGTSFTRSNGGEHRFNC